MKPEVAEYFSEKYQAQDIRVVPGHWPDFESKEQVDEWLAGLKKIEASFMLAFGDRNLYEDDVSQRACQACVYFTKPRESNGYYVRDTAMCAQNKDVSNWGILRHCKAFHAISADDYIARGFPVTLEGDKA